MAESGGTFPPACKPDHVYTSTEFSTFMGNSASHCMRTLMLARLTGLDQGWHLPMNYEPPPGSGSRFGVVGLVPCMVGGTKISH